MGGCVLREIYVRGGGLLMGTSGNRDCQWASRSVLKNFTEDALTFSGDSLFPSLLMELIGVAT